ncbi:MAG: hypothetical protein P8H62_08350 [Henriciella sp.]|nr:hypothetical protein [Henriciella sp.]
MSNAPPQAHPNWMPTATPKGWHYTSHPIWMRLSSVTSPRSGLVLGAALSAGAHAAKRVPFATRA